ncbi:TRAP transporter substrate-binding protein DctP [Chloroflexota bacterium]
MSKKYTLVLISTLVLLLAVMSLMGACAGEAPAPAPTPSPAPTPTPTPTPTPPSEPVTLKAVTFLPSHIGSVKFMGVFAEKAKERSNGQLIIDWVGGPEAIPRSDQPEALRTGLVDMFINPSAVLVDYVPEGELLSVTNMTPAEEREAGLFQYLQKQYEEKMGAYYLGRAKTHDTFTWIFLKKPVDKPEEMATLKLAGSLANSGPWKAMGIVPVVLPTAERYGAMERGIADGAASSFSSAVGMGWAEVTSYFIDHSPYWPNNLIFMANLESFNKLPKNLQDLMVEISIEIETEEEAFFADLEKDYRQKLIDAGMQPIKFSASDAAWFDKVHNDVIWEQVKDRISIEAYNTLKDLVAK